MATGTRYSRHAEIHHARSSCLWFSRATITAAPVHAIMLMAKLSLVANIRPISNPGIPQRGARVSETMASIPNSTSSDSWMNIRL